MKTQNSNIIKLYKLALKEHYCEDGWYFCPKTKKGCFNESTGDKCNCGTDSHNKKVEKVYKQLISNV